MATRPTVTPNRRGTRSREAVLDAAERLMAEHGYEAATVAALVDEAGVPASSIYHYFGSKEGVLLAVMERGAEQFFEALPDLDRRLGSQAEHLGALVETVADDARAEPGLPAPPRRHGHPARQGRGRRGPPGRQRRPGDGAGPPAGPDAPRLRRRPGRRRGGSTRALRPRAPSTAPSSRGRRTRSSASPGFSSTCPPR